MPVGIEAWVAQIPPITRGWLALSVLTSLAVQCQLVTPLQLYFSPKSFLNGQPWRAGTTFFYFGPISLDFVFHLFLLVRRSRLLLPCHVFIVSIFSVSMRYSRMLEESSFPNQKANYFWLLLLSSMMLLALSPLFNLPFLSSSLAFVPIYLWSRRHPLHPHLPLRPHHHHRTLPSHRARDLVGCAVGHVGWFLRDVWTREMLGGPTVFSDAPVRLKRMFGDE
ncbi:Derlin [Mycena venus]|uniref:Derlin n=1 Tax=Mycena venus TaxID=2733690 RepID=A0A8H6YU07_9AGAR|nr:Derlin [Mycena venus]